MNTLNSLASACKAFFKTEVPVDHQNQPQIEQLDSLKIKAVGLTTIATLAGFMNWPPYNKSAALFVLGYAGYEGYKVLGNAQQMFLREESGAKSSDELFGELTRGAPVARRVLPLMMKVESVKAKMFPA